MDPAAQLVDGTVPPRRVPGRRLLFAMLVILLVAVIPSVVVPTLMCRRADPKLTDIGTVAPFSLIDERGQPFTEDALRGHSTIISFIFTRCDSICPITTATMQRIQEKTFDAGTSIKLLSFSVDPQYDTPARLTAYAQRFQADAARWRFVTGPVDKVNAVIEGSFKSPMDPEGLSPGGAPSIAHAGYFLLVDGNLHIRGGTYDSRDLPRLDEMIRDARYLARTTGQ
jgi:protein SCO1/2